MALNAAPLLALQRVSFSYADRRLLQDVDFALWPGERVALAGGNGAGKSTLLHLLVGLRRPQHGEVVAFGQARRKEADFLTVRARAGLLFQDTDDQLFCPSVLEDVAFGPLNLGQSPAEARATALTTLAVLGLADHAERITHRLSGGEKRLVALATVLAMNPQVLLLDEPTNGLDDQARNRLLTHLRQLPQAMLFVTHDLDLMGQLATRALLLEQGRLRDAVIHSHRHEHEHVHLHIPEALKEHGATH